MPDPDCGSECPVDEKTPYTDEIPKLISEAQPYLNVALLRQLDTADLAVAAWNLRRTLSLFRKVSVHA